ncbi:MAG: aldo/keto reductase [Hyphomicrobiales bacterium]|nr:MAG: aldo/keto reductase [Hyphomicrobiales bacterium]
MEMRKLGRTDIEVSSICLGTMTFGEQNTRAEGFAQMDRSIDAGINFFDMAELYAIPPKPETTGRTEEIVGDWLVARKNRDKVIIATKTVGHTDGMTWFRDDGSNAKLDLPNIREAVEKSLARLKTDYIDLYQIHWPDRRTSLFGANPSQYHHPETRDDEVSIEETLEAFAVMQKEGKIREIGLSNESCWGTMRFLEAHRANSVPRVASIQNAYSFVNRTYETNLAELTMREDVGLLAYSVLAQGYLTGKYRDGAKPAGARRTLFERLGRYEGAGSESAINAYLDLAIEFGIDPCQLAIAHAESRCFCTSVIIGATNMDQLEIALGSNDVTITPELEERINTLHQIHGNPCP